MFFALRTVECRIKRQNNKTGERCRKGIDTKMRYYYEDKERVLQSLGSCEQGLSDAEAAARLERNGRNKLKEAKKESLLSRFFNQLKDPMIIILIAAAIVSGVVSVVEKESFSTR